MAHQGQGEDHGDAEHSGGGDADMGAGAEAQGRGDGDEDDDEYPQLTVGDLSDEHAELVGEVEVSLSTHGVDEGENEHGDGRQCPHHRGDFGDPNGSRPQRIERKVLSRVLVSAAATTGGTRKDEDGEHEGADGQRHRGIEDELRCGKTETDDGAGVIEQSRIGCPGEEERGQSCDQPEEYDDGDRGTLNEPCDRLET